MGYLAILLAALLWGLIGPVSRVALADGVEPAEVAFWRATLAIPLFGVHALVRRRLRVAPRDVPAVVLFGLAGISGLYGAYFLAVQHGGAALAAVLLYTAPAWVALLSRLLLGEALGPRKLAALALTLAGVALVALGEAGPVRVTRPALLWGLVSGWAYALYYLFGKRFFGRYEAPTLFLYALPVGALGLLPTVRFHEKTPQAWGALLALAVLSTYGAYLAYEAGLRRLEATRAALVATVEPVVASVLAWAVWGERFAATGYVGAALVVTGVLVTALDGRRPGSPS
jgi:drug/metabolite transporter, DME family